MIWGTVAELFPGLPWCRGLYSRHGTSSVSGLPIVARRAAINWMIYAMSFAGYCACALAYSSLTEGSGSAAAATREAVTVLLAVSFIASSAAFLASGLRRYRIALAVRLAAYLLIEPLVAGARPVEIILLSGLVAEIAAYERYPLNLAIGSGVVGASLALRLAVFLGRGLSLPSSLLGEIDYLFLGFILVAPASLATRYREELIAVKREKSRLDETAVKLTTLNLQYQDFATSAAEIAMEDERKRVTRDIHDVVGYTLTNNIAMMEAATDMMRRNPFGIPALINAARENAQEGLDLIRDSLYRLRADVSPHPIGLRAITRMCRIFEKATGIRVRLEYGNATGTYEDAIDSAIYHLAQEALINSFRHGRAGSVTVSLFEIGDSISVSIGDDGSGAPAFKEGIGLRGMRERIEKLGGQLTVNGQRGGFSIHARIPRNGSEPCPST